jgi:hypothetical protein
MSRRRAIAFGVGTGLMGAMCSTMYHLQVKGPLWAVILVAVCIAGFGIANYEEGKIVGRENAEWEHECKARREALRKERGK